MNLPKMELFVPNPQSRGYGHQFRCFALKEAYESLGGSATIHYGTYPNELPDCIVVFDGLRPIYHKYDNALIVYIDDSLPLDDYRVDVLINQNTHIDAPFGNLSHLYGSLKCTKLIGFEYFMRRTDYNLVTVRDEGYIAFFPGSSSLLDEFPFRTHLMQTLEQYPIHRLSGLSSYQMADEIAGARLVITACSVSALESCSIGKPTLVIQTADNQFYLNTALSYLGATLPYTRHNLFELLHSVESRELLGNRAKQLIPSDGANRVALKLIEKAKEIGLND